MLEALRILQSSPWVPGMIIALGVATVVWRINARWAAQADATDVRAKAHELTKIGTANAVTKIEHHS
jgi:hypothetical protein